MGGSGGDNKVGEHPGISGRQCAMPNAQCRDAQVQIMSAT